MAWLTRQHRAGRKRAAFWATQGYENLRRARVMMAALREASKRWYEADMIEDLVPKTLELRKR